MDDNNFSATQIAYDGIRRMIFVTHELRPGQKLVESNIAQKLSISRTPVREAIHRLQQDGLIERIQNRGSFVCIPKKEDIVHSYEIIMALYAMVCFTLAERKRGGEPMREMFSRLHDAMDAMEAAAESGDQELFLMLDRDFHFYLAFCSDNERLCRMYRHSHEMVFHDTWCMPSGVFNGKISCAEHRMIVEAIESGNPIQAQQLALNHMARTRRRIQESNI